MTVGVPLTLFNSLGRRLEEFTPAGAEVGIYSCGPTVYAYPHLGNMRPYVFADTLRRALRWKGLPNRHVVNITDVGHAVAEAELGDDKLEVAAARERRSVDDIAAHYTKAFFYDLEALNIMPAHEYPRATQYVDQMIELATVLEERGFAYTIPSGLYFDTSKLPNYGALAMMDIEGQREGARVEQVEGRRSKSDFALWRAEEPGKVRVMRWKSPWGWGAPGWHLECSVMSIALLGGHFDIHTGGIDHRELHHVNEIAQSEAYLGDGKPWVRYWMHNEFLQLNNRKIAKSEGRAPRLADLVEAGYHPMAYRLFLLGGHYRSQLDFTGAAVDGAQATMRRLVGRIAGSRPLPPIETLEQARAAATAAEDNRAAEVIDALDVAISSDLGTPQLLAILQDSTRDPDLTEAGRAVVFAACDSMLGLGLATLEVAELESGRERSVLSPDELATIERLIIERTEARSGRLWARADEIREELDQLGVHVKDTPDGPVWSLRE